MKILSTTVAVIAALLLIASLLLLGDVDRITPNGEGVVAIEAGDF